MFESTVPLPASEPGLLDPDSSEAPQLLVQARDRALLLLARREHSRYELVHKLSHYRDTVDLEALLDELVELGLQSDRRYASVLVRSKAQSGYGLARIRQWGKQYGLCHEDMSLAIEEQQFDWFAAALRQRQKHFGVMPPSTIQDKAKQMRYLYNRGFSQDQIHYAVDAEVNTTSDMV
ncbi:MAG: regulatory protein RecX [Gammaproteobacteria bacterium]|jgi:regulatory protein|nr:regulatory protein RecX [Gammaproteobacteria bacterium]